ncbi:MAG: ribose 5-phosphate isomerase B [Micrococcales bacterium]|nr:ribose 5-phosphate isomerase B [Micrococcales bacterium]
MDAGAIHTVAIGSDHAGYALKTAIADFLRDSGYEVTDVGTHSDDRVDYPHFAAAVAHLVVDGDVERGVLVCGSGQGVSIAANKVPGARAGVVREVYDAEMLRKHNNANIACFGQQATDEETARSAVHAFLTTDFEGGRHQARVEQLTALDKGESV